MRTASVLTPRRVSQASNGPATAPVAFWTKASRSPSSGSATTTAPPTTSEWPPRYLVVEWTTASAPSASGFCRYGEANVLSTTSSAPASAHSSATALMSTIDSSGLVGVSTQTTRAGLSFRACRTAFGSDTGTGRQLTFHPAKTLSNNRYVPPYA